MLRKNSLNSSSSNNLTKFSQIYERFMEIQEKKKEKLKQLKKLNEEKEKKQCYFRPKINKKSESIKDDFYKRQQDKIEEQKKKNEKIKFKYKQQYDDKTNKNKKLIKKKNNEKNQNQKTSDVSDRINKLYQWDNNRKQKIHERQKSVDELTKKEFSFKPKINKKSKKLAMNNLEKYLYSSKSGYNANNDNPKNTINECTFDRLYRDDVMKRKERQKILEKIYSPTFSPKITKYNRNVFNRKTDDENEELQIDDDNFSINNKKSLNISKTYSIDKNNNNIDREFDTISYNATPNYKINDSEMSLEYFNDNDYIQQIRSRLFGKLSRSKNKSAINLKKINEMKIEENNDSDDEDENDYKRNKRNSIESESNDKKLSSGKNSKSYNIYKIKVKIKNPSNFETKDRNDDISSNNNNKKGRNRTVGFRI